MAIIIVTIRIILIIGNIIIISITGIITGFIPLAMSGGIGILITRREAAIRESGARLSMKEIRGCLPWHRILSAIAIQPAFTGHGARPS